LNQLHSLKFTGFYEKLGTAAGEHNFPASFLFAIASRETNCLNELGDYQNGEAHGVGIVQIDIQHQIAKDARNDGSWKTDPEPLIEFGATMLADNINQAKQAFPDLPVASQLKIAASGYNCGMARAISGAKNGDSDSHTTGGDYGRDVITRMTIFDDLIATNA
jgi:hypothetical protein